MSNAMQEAITAIRNFLDGQGDPWAWDDFLSVPVSDPEVRRLQGFCRQLPHDYPPEQGTDYCSRAGMERLRTLLDELTSDATPVFSAQ